MTVFYEAPGIQVTETFITMNNMSYAVRNVSAVGREVKKESANLAMIIIIVGIILALFSLANRAASGGGGGHLFVAAALILFGGYLHKKRATKYTIILSTNAGQVHAFTTTNAEQISAIEEAIRQAIASH